MKKIINLIFLVLVSLVTNAQDNLFFPIEPNSISDWNYVSDRVMGGVSTGAASLERDGDITFARLTGDVSTRNNGGFIQLRSKVSLFDKPKMFQSIHNAGKNGESLEGVRLKVRGNGETYHVMIRTYFNWSPSDYYFHTFNTGPDWKIVELPFIDFRRSNLKDTALDINQIRDFGIVAYGRNFKSDISISFLEFY
jgi:hypothetical protein